ncbi:MAG TPA: amidohydrolase family protein [Planctomycetota bacterium]
MIIDAHQHFWDLKVFPQDWTTGPIRRSFLPRHLAPLLKKAGVDRTVFVQTKHDLRENDWALGLDAPFVAGVVGWVDLAAKDVERQLLDFLRHPKAVGVRHVVQDEPDVDWVVRPDVLRGLRTLAKHGVPFDLLTYVKQLPHAATLAEIDGLRIVIDHLSKPLVKEGRILGWIDDFRAAAKFPNVYCKLSSLVTQADWKRWTAADLRPYVNVALDLFGPDRLMFGSDWPVCLLASSYQDWIDTLRDLLAPLSKAERARIFGGTAKAFYRLKGIA